MTRIVTIITENIFVVLGFALYCGLVYYMIARAIRRYTGRKSTGRRAGNKQMNSSASKEWSRIYPESGIDNLFVSLFTNKDPDESESQPGARRDFSKSFQAANTFTDNNNSQ